MVSIILQGVTFGFLMAMIIGPIAFLIVKNTIHYGFIAGFCTSLGAATADAAYGCVAGFGLTTISCFLLAEQFWINLFGGLFLCYLGITTFIAPFKTTNKLITGNSLFNMYGTTFLLTMANPNTMISFTALFAALGLGTACGSYAAAFTFVLGVFLGSILFGAILVGAISTMRKKFDIKILAYTNKISGAILVLFGMYSLSKLLN